jgi:hypothetical protein
MFCAGLSDRKSTELRPCRLCRDRLQEDTSAPAMTTRRFCDVCILWACVLAAVVRATAASPGAVPDDLRDSSIHIVWGVMPDRGLKAYETSNRARIAAVADRFLHETLQPVLTLGEWQFAVADRLEPAAGTVADGFKAQRHILQKAPQMVFKSGGASPSAGLAHQHPGSPTGTRPFCSSQSSCLTIANPACFLSEFAWPQGSSSTGTNTRERCWGRSTLTAAP